MNSADEISKVIETDPATVARILKIANSTYYNVGGKEISSVQQAVALLGNAEIRKICLALSAIRMFVRPSVHVDHRTFWKHSITVANMCTFIHSLCPGLEFSSDEAYTAGLLHEIGALIFDQFFDRIYQVVLRESDRTGRSIHLIEFEYLKLTHADIGGILLQRWGLPNGLVQSVRFHHNPSQVSDRHLSLCQLVHLADFFCTQRGYAGPGELNLSMVSSRAWQDLNIEPDSLTQHIDKIAEEADRSAVFVSLAA